ncbi:MAG: four helix bundle protein, partial [Deltaproteobacteria bacterium]|nr:four helix bundle protein [Deltaproteobacteria bacterium]
MLKNYKDLKVWQKSYELCLEIYRIIATFPKAARHGLTSPIRRSVVSIPSNIAESERMLKALIKSLENKPLNP